MSREGYSKVRASNVAGHSLLDNLLEEYDSSRIIKQAEYNEARERYRVLTEIVKQSVRADTYLNGSLDHGDAMSPLNDIDLGVILTGSRAESARRSAPIWAVEGVVKTLQNDPTFSSIAKNVTCANQKRAALVSFCRVLTSDEGCSCLDSSPFNFTADIIVALQAPRGGGFLVPNLFTNSWERSHPLRHSMLVREKALAQGPNWRRAVRLMKSWNYAHGKQLSSWNIKALALRCRAEGSVADALAELLNTVQKAIIVGPTTDPAGISEPIPLLAPASEVLRSLNYANATLARARVASSRSDRRGVSMLIGDLLNGHRHQELDI